MSKAFYPTNDGHVGNLRKLSTIEIRDLLKRQEDLLKKKQSLLNKLPDKGARIKKHLEDLQHELTRRETLDPVETPSVPVDSKQNTQQKDITDNQTGRNYKEIIVPVRSDEEEQKENILEKELKKLSVKDNMKEKGEYLRPADKQKHQYELALERAEKNLQSGLKQPMKLNRALKVEHVKDLPEEILQMKCSVPDRNKQHENNMECSKVIEESAAVPPNYKFPEVKVIDIEESLSLQKQQKQIQEELNAELAAEKLAERLHIKMETYNPEGADMSYRSSRGGQYVEDSDDDDDDDEDVDTAAYSKTMVPSDTED